MILILEDVWDTATTTTIKKNLEGDIYYIECLARYLCIPRRYFIFARFFFPVFCCNSSPTLIEEISIGSAHKSIKKRTQVHQNLRIQNLQEFYTRMCIEGEKDFSDMKKEIPVYRPSSKQFFTYHVSFSCENPCEDSISSSNLHSSFRHFILRILREASNRIQLLFSSLFAH